MREGKRSILLRGNVTLKERRENVGSGNSTEFNMAGKQVFHEKVGQGGWRQRPRSEHKKVFLIILKVMRSH